MKYSKPETLSHIISINNSSCLIIFNDLIVNDGFDGLLPVFKHDVIVLDMDGVERNIAKNDGNRNRNSSMDCTFAIKNEDKTEMLLVELRFNYKNLKNLSQKKLHSKVKYSKINLGNSTPTSESYVFIFNSKLKEEAKSWFFRKFSSNPKNYKVMDIQELKEKYF